MVRFVLEALRLSIRAFFRPFALNDELRGAGSYLATNVPVWQVRTGLNPGERRVVFQALVAVVLSAIVWPLVGGAVAWRLGDSLWWANVLLVILASGFVGIIGLLGVGLAFGLTMGPAVSLAGTLVTIIGLRPLLALIRTGQVAGIIGTGLAVGLVLGVILGLASIAAFTLRPAASWFGSISAVGGGLTMGLLLLRTGNQGVNEEALAIVLAVFFFLGFGDGYLLGYRRLPLYLVELPWQMMLTGLSRLTVKADRSGQWVQRFYKLSPVRWDELIWFPLWTLDRQLLCLALAEDRATARETIVRIARTFRQGWAAEAALAAIVAHDLRDCRSIPEIAQAAELLRWFPRAVDLPTLALRRVVTRLNEVSQSAEAAIRTLGSPGWRINLRKAQAGLDELQAALDKVDRRVAASLLPIVRCWREAVAEALKGVRRDAGPVLIENIYIAGNPITRDREDVFVGREDLFARIQEDLTAVQKPTLVLHGQRRTGKTSLLLQLPNRLPADYVPVYVDLQKTAPVDGLNRFLYTLADEAVRQADEVRRIALPPVALEDFYYRGPHAFYDWLEQARRRLEGRLLLFALDEFEKIEEAIEKKQLEEAVLDVLRHLIQHHAPWLVLLLAGVRTLDEMARSWHSYFISVRPLHVSYLEREAARDLIQLPAERYPIRYDRQAVEAILTATRAQPFLVQAVCFELVQYLNSPRRRMAGPFGQVTVADAREAIQRAVRSAHPYFADLWNSADARERLVLAELAHRPGEWVRIDDLCKGNDLQREEVHQIVSRLRQREVLDRREQRVCRFQVPMVRRWIREEKSLEAVRLASRSSS